MDEVEVLVVGAGQAGLSAAHHLARLGFTPGSRMIVLDAGEGPGGAWRNRWESLRFGTAHRVYPLPGMDVPEVDPTRPASEVVAGYYGGYESAEGLAVRRPVAVTSVRREDDDPRGRLLVTTDHGTWATRMLVNATGTWDRPFVPYYPGAETFAGWQLHTAQYRSASDFAGRHTIVVGGGASAVQLLDEVSRVTTTTWVTRREPVWHEGPFDEDWGRASIALVESRVRSGLPTGSVVSVTGLAVTPQTEAMRLRGVLERHPMFSRIRPDGVEWASGKFVPAGIIFWNTGFRPALDHLAPLHLRAPGGGIRMDGTAVADDERIHLVGYGTSASTIGANRAGREAARRIRRFLRDQGSLPETSLITNG